MDNWTAGPAPEETAILANMDPNTEYAASDLARLIGTTHQKISSTLRSIRRSELISTYRKPGINCLLYKTNQLVIDLGGVEMNPSETKQERTKRQARERKRQERARKKAHLQAVGAQDLKFTAYRSTSEALEKLVAFNECEEWQEVTTLLIHNAADLIERNPSQLKELLSVKRHAQGRNND